METVGAKEALDRVCSTNQRTFEGTVYTLSDVRYPELIGKRIVATLERGKTVYRWEEFGSRQVSG